jgi:hypothetical protein
MTKKIRIVLAPYSELPAEPDDCKATIRRLRSSYTNPAIKASDDCSLQETLTKNAVDRIVNANSAREFIHARRARARHEHPYGDGFRRKHIKHRTDCAVKRVTFESEAKGRGCGLSLLFSRKFRSICVTKRRRTTARFRKNFTKHAFLRLLAWGVEQNQIIFRRHGCLLQFRGNPPQSV